MIQSKTEIVERWGVFEIAVGGKKDGNPFTDYDIRGTFTHRCQTVTADGFYDGDGVYKVRFMPSFEGEYQYEITGSFSDEPVSGRFTVTAPSKGNHAPSGSRKPIISLMRMARRTTRSAPPAMSGTSRQRSFRSRRWKP